MAELSGTPWDNFPEEAREDVEGLTWIGYLEDSFSFAGHDFAIQTLRGEGELIAALITKEFQETFGEGRAHIWATVALALTAVDGDQEFCPAATPNRIEQAKARFRYLTGNWYWPVAAYIFERYSALQRRQQEAVEALETFCKGSLNMPMPGAGSSIDKAFSAPEAEDIREFLNPED
jgi:hypothetical protein